MGKTTEDSQRGTDPQHLGTETHPSTTEQLRSPSGLAVYHGVTDEDSRSVSGKVARGEESVAISEKREPNDRIHGVTPNIQKPNPFDNVNPISFVTLGWITSIISLGSKKTLLDEDVWQAPKAHSTTTIAPEFDRAWQLYSAKEKVKAPGEKATGKGTRLEKSLLRFRRRRLFYSGLCFLGYCFCTLATPYVIQAVVSYVSRVPDYKFLGMSSGYAFAFILVALRLGLALAQNLAFTYQVNIGMDMRNTLIDRIYQKALVLSVAAKQASSSGELITLMSVDTERIYQSTIDLHWLWSGPLILFVGVGLLIDYLGVAALAGIGVMLLTVIAQSYIATLIAKYRTETVQHTEDRIKLINEALRGIRIIKYYAWEGPIAERVEAVRAREIECSMKLGYCFTAFITLLILTPAVLLGVTFVTYTALGNTLTVPLVFTTMAFMAVIEFPLNVLPLVVSEVVQAHVSAKRIENWLDMDEAPPTASNPQLAGAPAGTLALEDAAFVWPKVKPLDEGKEDDKKKKGNKKGQDRDSSTEGSDNKEVKLLSGADVSDETTNQGEEVAVLPFTLSNLNVTIVPGTLCAVVGSVGSGKSSFMNAVIGQMQQQSGFLTATGTISYVAQEAWIPHGTLRDTILFERPYNAKLYKKVLEAAQLKADLAALPAGDQTEIGEKGINLSGGQKARVSFARALYREEADIYLLDDPLSAVDASVAKRMFEVGIKGMLRGKTRVLVMNSHYEFLKHTDLVMIFSEGRMVAAGSPNELSASYPEFFEAVEKPDADVTTEVAVAPLPRWQSRLDSETGSRNALSRQVDDKDDEGRLLEEEDREVGSVSKETYINYFMAAGRWGLTVMCIVLCLFVLGQACLTFSEWWLGAWGEQRFDFDGDAWYIYGYLMIGGVASVVIGLRMALLIVTLLRICQRIHDGVFKAVLSAPLTTFFDVTPLGRIMNRFSKDMDHVDSSMPNFLSNLLGNVVLIGAALIVACMSQPYVILALIPAVIAFFLLQRFFRQSNRELKRLESITRSPIFSLFGETLSGISTIKAFNMQKIFVGKNRTAVDNNIRHFFCYYMSGRWLALRLDLLSIFFVMVVAIFVVAFRGEGVSPSVAGLALNYSLLLTGTLQWTVRVFILFENSMTSVERLLHYGRLPREGTLSEGKGENGEDKPLVLVRQGQETISKDWPQEGGIELSNVMMRYRPELELVLKGVTMSIKPGEKVGIVGRTGAGKSSIMLALYRMVEIESGTIKIDGVDISTLELHALRSKLSIIPQDPVMFSGTVRYNLDPLEEYSDAQLWQALERVHLSDVVGKMEKKLESEVSEGGENWSVGQRQLICIARALLRKTKVLIMDEATASVDSNSDTLIQQMIRENFADRTVLCIAHRLDTVIDADRIAVIDAGIVKEFDKPRTLLSDEGSAFSALAKHLGEDTYRRLEDLAKKSI